MAESSGVPGHNIPPAPDLEGATHLHSGKVRDLYRLDDGHLLMVASDRISAYDFVLDSTIPDKGEILTRMSLWWFAQLADLVPHHVLSTDVPEQVKGRAVVCEELAMYPVECVARGYLTGSGLLDYQARGEVCGIALPKGLVDGSRLPEPLFTPASKAALGTTTRTSPSRRSSATSAPRSQPRLRDADPGGLRPRRADRPGARHHPGRHEVRVRLPPRRRRSLRGWHRAGRRGAHAGLQPLLAGRRVGARPGAGRPTTSRSCATG